MTQKVCVPVIEEGKIRKPVTFFFGHNTEKAPFLGKTFGQDIEPAGEYLICDESKGEFKLPGWTYGTITLENPLVLPWNGYGEDGWKRQLSKRYQNKTGVKLSKAIVEDGFDGIITLDNGRFSEIVNLKLLSVERF